jgi:lipopolysaccharide transport system ATP-binding protein
MVVRLAFAVQSQIEPDILIVDEALSVGDVKFQAKCFDRLRQLKENGTSILLVTHSSEQVVSHCTAALLLNKGQQIELGEPKRVVNRYMDLLFGKDSNQTKDEAAVALTQTPKAPSIELSHTEDVFANRIGYNPHEYRWGDKKALILDYKLVANGEPYPSAISTGQKIDLFLVVKFMTAIFRPILGVTIKTKEGITVYGANSETLKQTDLSDAGVENSTLEMKVSFVCDLAYGDYFISLGLASKHGEEVIPHDRRYDSIHMQVRPNNTFFGLIDMKMSMTSIKL